MKESKRVRRELVNGANGIYAGQVFAQTEVFYSPDNPTGWQGITPSYIAILEEGPDNPDYIEVWANVLDSANAGVVRREGHRTYVLDIDNSGNVYEVS
jgi:hypothetical protein